MKKITEFTREEIEQSLSKTKQLFLSLPNLDASRLNKTFEIGDNIIWTFYDNHETVIINAPTGFGKSMLAFYLSQVFNALNLSTYVLTPNKFLQEQYSKDVDKFKLPSTIMLKGVGNYICKINGKSIAQRECDDYSFTEVISGKSTYNCMHTCVYMQLRKKAIEQNVSIINYPFWLLQMNMVFSKLADSAPFKVRSLTIFDESHNIGNIVQNQFSVNFDLNALIKRCMSSSKVIEFLTNEKFTLTDSRCSYYVDIVNAVLRLQAEYNKHREWQMSDFATVKTEWLALLNAIKRIGDVITSPLARVSKKILDSHPEITSKQIVKYASPDEKVVFELYSYISGIVDSFTELDAIFSQFGYRSLTCTFKIDKESTQIAPYGECSQYVCNFNCAQEASIVQSKVLQFTAYSVFMSATFGNIDDYAKQTGIEKYAKIEVPVQFSFEKSPIYLATPLINMGYKNKAQNMYEMGERVLAFCNLHKGKRGIIHTGNFEIMRYLAGIENKRILYYDAKNKSEVLKRFASTSDAIICGPSLIEGIDLKDDLARFMIFCKVPFMSLGDELVKRKMHIYPNWYNWVTMSQIEQGLGRGIRNNNDWCETLLIDENFESFFKRYSPPKYIQDRLETLPFSMLKPNAEDDKTAFVPTYLDSNVTVNNWFESEFDADNLPF